MKIEVTQKHIDAAESRTHPRSKTCAIARALQDAGFPDAQVVFTCAMPLGFWNQSVGLPKKVQAFINASDGGEKVSPFSFEIEFDKPAKP